MCCCIQQTLAMQFRMSSFQLCQQKTSNLKVTNKSFCTQLLKVHPIRSVLRCLQSLCVNIIKNFSIMCIYQNNMLRLNLFMKVDIFSVLFQVLIDKGYHIEMMLVFHFNFKSFTFFLSKPLSSKNIQSLTTLFKYKFHLTFSIDVCFQKKEKKLLISANKRTHGNQPSIF